MNGDVMKSLIERGMQRELEPHRTSIVFPISKLEGVRNIIDTVTKVKIKVDRHRKVVFLTLTGKAKDVLLLVDSLWNKIESE